MLRQVAKKFTPKYVPIRSLVQNTNGTESLFIKGTEDNQLLKFGGLILTTISVTGGGAFGLFSMMKKEIKDAISPLDNKLNKLDDRTHTLAVDMAHVKNDMAYIKMHLGLTELKQDSSASPVSPLKPKTK